MPKRLLIAEDSPLGSEIAAAAEARGWEVDPVQRGRNLLLRIEREEMYDAAIMDIIMPVESDQYTRDDQDETGLRLAENLLEKQLCPAVLFMSVRAAETEIQAKIASLGQRFPAATVAWRAKSDPLGVIDNLVVQVEEMIGGGGHEPR